MPKTAVKTKNSLEFPCVDVVEASAGSGKTYALAKRYVQLILNPSLKAEEMLLKTILAVTFTNKATVEMKQRIFEFLKRIALDAFPNQNEKQDILSSLVIDYPTARKMAHDTMENIISHYNFFHVQTIDSFINMLLKGCAFHLGFASNFRIKENYRAYLTYSLDRLIDRVHGDKKILDVFEEFLKYYLFVENKEGWFSKRDILELIETLYGYSNIYGGIFQKPDVKTKELIKKKKTIIKLIEKIRENAPEGTHKGFINALDTFLEKNKEVFSIENISDFFAREAFPMTKYASTPQEVVKLWDDMRKNLRELCRWESFAVFRSYIEIFNLVLDEFRKLTSIDDIIFLRELNVHARGLINENGVSVPEIYYRIATRFHHYLIDEFQDTNRLQWKNIFPMVEEALSSGGSLFCVGDKKQAIFRFRGGDVSLFDSIQDDFRNYAPKQTVLSKNYRSQKEIVEFNNKVFSVDNLKQFVEAVINSQDKSVKFTDRDIDSVLNAFSDSKQEWREENKYGYVKVETFTAPTVDERDTIMHEKFILLFKELEKRFSPGDIAILARENKDIELFTSWLIEENIPVESEKTLSIREHALIKELISFLKFLNSPIDNMSFASFILGDIFEKASGISRDTVQDFLFRLRSRGKKERGVYLYREFRNKFTKAWDDLIDEFFKSVGFAPLYELMISIFSKFKVVENFPQYQAFFMRLLELVKKKEEDYSGVSSFLEFFEEIEQKDLFVNVTHTDAVKIVTIHKSKGLEFPVVIIPFLEIDVVVGSGVTASRKPYVVRQSENGNNLRLIQLRKKYGAFSERLGKEYKDEYIKSLIDELNGLYVALTRAKHELYLFIPSKTSNKNNLARALIRCETDENGSKREYKHPENKEERPFITLPVSQYSDWLGILKDEFISQLELVHRDNLKKGNILHLILSCIGNLHLEDKDASLNIAREKTKSVFPYEKDLGGYISIVRGILEDKKFKPFFYVKEGDIYQEKEVADLSGTRKVIDRLIVTSKEAWVVDYKSSKDETDLQKEQVLEYMNMVMSLYPGLKIKGFLIYLDTLAIEEVHGKNSKL